MIRNRARLPMVAGVTLATVLGVTLATVLSTATLAYASIGPNTTVTGTLQSGTDMYFYGTIDSIRITVSCANFTASGKTGSKPATSFKLSSPPTINGCTDSLGGTDTIKTKGKWSLSVNSAGTEVTLTIPKKGATFTSSVESGCTITAAPKKAVGVTGAYSNGNTVTVDQGTQADPTGNGSIATSAKGCTSGPAYSDATVVLSPAPGAPPWG